jgi:hypothetical protein
MKKSGPAGASIAVAGAAGEAAAAEAAGDLRRSS